MNLDLGVKALRSKTVPSNTDVVTTVQTATSLVQDLKALQLMQSYLGTNSTKAALATNTIIENPEQSLRLLAEYLRNFVCSYVFTYDELLNPSSEIPALNLYTESEVTKDPNDLLNLIESDLIVPSIPGNIFYTACSNNLSSYNPDLYTAFTAAKLLPENTSKSDSEIISSLIPKYPLPGLRSGLEAIPSELLTRWEQIVNMTATNWTSGGVSIVTEISELIPIVGLRTLVHYRAFMAIRQIDRELEKISDQVAATMVSLYQQVGEPLHPEVWLSQLKKRVKNQVSTTSVLLDYLSGKTFIDEINYIWQWLGTVPSVASSTPTDLIPIFADNPDLEIARLTSLNYITTFLNVLLGAFQIPVNSNTSTRSNLFSDTFETWKETLTNYGGILGFEGILVIVALNQLERIRVATTLENVTDEDFTKLGEEGLRIAQHISNGKFLEDAFMGLIS